MSAFLTSLWKYAPTVCRVVRFFSKRMPNRGLVLIVEDNPHDSELLEYKILKLGYESESASSADVAKGLVSHTFYRFAFIDLRLPGMSGQAFLRLLSEKSPHTHLIICCGEPGDLAGQRNPVTGLMDAPSTNLTPFVIVKPATLEAVKRVFENLKP